MKKTALPSRALAITALIALQLGAAQANEVTGTVERLWHCDDGTDDRWFVVELSDGSKSASVTGHTNKGWSAMDRNNFAMALAAYEAEHPIKILRKGTASISKCNQDIGWQIDYIMFDRMLEQ